TVPNDAEAKVAAAGGELVQRYDAIGVAIARSPSSSFGADLTALDSQVEGASASDGLGTQLTDEIIVEASDTPATTAAAGGLEPLEPLQWDMRQIKVPEAQAVTQGSPSVIVGVIDTGIDYTHPDLAQNIDFSRSVSCVGGVPDQTPAAWRDRHGHGTHTSGTIAAARNGIGITGIAPNVKLAAIRAADDEGYLYPEAVVCGFMWAAEHQIDVTNNSYFVDPWYFNCRNDAEQRVIWKAVQRAVRYAMGRGVTVVAATGNSNIDLAHPTVDTLSPDNTTPIPREVTNACLILPAEIPGVVAVSADGNNQQKAYYSNYGQGVVELTAPGGDSRFQRTAEAPNGTILSTIPGGRYGYAQGTSMAAPHVTGVAALAISQHGKMPPSRLLTLLKSTADPLPCPADPFNPGPPYNYSASCQGGANRNGFYGSGQVNALGAVSTKP
ncbi:MAG: hypothetical protein JWN15_4355, partial [Firmicutes bacterium]|nr:hypothetical protein [Bacillota bacterium]